MKVPLQLHRSVIFWAGLFVMTFIVWAWRDSRHNSSWVLSPKGLVSVHEHGYLSLGRLPKSGPEWGYDREWVGKTIIPELFPPPFAVLHGGSKPYEEARHPETEKAYVLRRWSSAGPDEWAVFVPHWLVLLVVVLLWIGLLGWRARRRRRVFASLDGTNRGGPTSP